MLSDISPRFFDQRFHLIFIYLIRATSTAYSILLDIVTGNAQRRVVPTVCEILSSCFPTLRTVQTNFSIVDFVCDSLNVCDNACFITTVIILDIVLFTHISFLDVSRVGSTLSGDSSSHP
jgi:hypothetical protein